MAEVTKTQVTLIDDLDGSVAVKSVEFALDGIAYEIDLSAKHLTEFTAVLHPYLSAARRPKKKAAKATKAVKKTAEKRSRAGRNANPEVQAIRAWAAANGHEIGLRGRISAAVLDAYHQDSGT